MPSGFRLDGRCSPQRREGAKRQNADMPGQSWSSIGVVGNFPASALWSARGGSVSGRSARPVTSMGTPSAYGLLLLAACLEVGGDALIRLGLHNHLAAARIALFLGGAAVLFVYGLSVNAPPWDFGRLLGVYVTLVFVVAQVLNFIVFGAKPDLPILIGGALIISGGLVMTLWRSS
jgi:drug/metabolite transporter superfamily protein YnfA